MEHHGENPKQNVIAIIPARYASTRLPGKMLLDVGGEPMIVRTARQAAAARLVSRVIVATDDDRIYEALAGHGIEAVMTSSEHRCGSDRVAEVAEKLPARTIVVNVQGDEPTIAPETIDAAVNTMLADTGADIVTTSEAIHDVSELNDPNVVKVVTDLRGNAIYFSRSPIPFPRSAIGVTAEKTFDAATLSDFRKHTGLYVYRREFLLSFSRMEQTPLEKLEMLEQLRALEHGARIRVVPATGRSIGVDTADDLEKVRAIAGRA